MKKNFLIVTVLFTVLIFFPSCNKSKTTLDVQNNIEEEIVEQKEEANKPLVEVKGIDADGFEVFVSELDDANPFLATNEDFFDKDEAYYQFKDEMLILGTFHEDEVQSGLESKAWVGLVGNDSNYSIEKVHPLIKKVFDPVLDEKGEASATEIYVDNNKSHTYIFAQSIGIKEGDVDTVTSLPVYIYPGDVVNFTFNGQAYTLFATGKKKSLDLSDDDLNSAEPDMLPMYAYEVMDYRLYLTSTAPNTSTSTTMLYATPFTEDAMPAAILFAGDLNKDEKLDLILDTTFNYNMNRPTLYLSQPCTTNNCLPIKPVAAIKSVGC